MLRRSVNARIGLNDVRLHRACHHHREHHHHRSGCSVSAGSSDNCSTVAGRGRGSACRGPVAAVCRVTRTVWWTAWRSARGARGPEPAGGLGVLPLPVLSFCCMFPLPLSRYTLPCLSVSTLLLPALFAGCVEGLPAAWAGFCGFCEGLAGRLRPPAVAFGPRRRTPACCRDRCLEIVAVVDVDVIAATVVSAVTIVAAGMMVVVWRMVHRRTPVSAVIAASIEAHAEPAAAVGKPMPQPVHGL